MHAPVYLVRHGQSEWNLRRLTQGQTKHPALTGLGREQASRAAEAIATDLARGGLVSARLLTSDLVRATETARIIGSRIGLVPQPDARLREQHLGSLEGRSHEDSWAQAELHDWSDPELPIAGGESVGQVRRRVAAVLAEVDPRVPTVLVSHGDAIRCAIAHLEGRSMTDAPWVEVPNGSVSRFVGEIRWLDLQPP
ncbi:histidine phosphatase family protein [Nocardioides sp.]|uniref:histidine phosphatase family protein n=1 Tax=Nocardioides sp. TaxID=35761 RepID=UPI002CFC4299|nr:histidine phosphatase family protein [Nocardioides sp.]HXH79439.1 histidine phosphatase family protein [Nocardioides sp.]